MHLFELFHHLLTFENLVIVDGELSQQLNHESIPISEKADKHWFLQRVKQHLILLHNII